MTFRSIFGAAIVLLLLVLYVLLAGSAVNLLDCTPQPACLKDFSDSMTTYLALIGGLVSAVAITELAITVPKKQPFSRFLPDTAGKTARITLGVLTFLYLSAWLGVGLWVLVATWQRPDALPALTALSKSWISLAVAAGYAYFGIQPNV